VGTIHEELVGPVDFPRSNPTPIKLHLPMLHMTNADLIPLPRRCAESPNLLPCRLLLDTAPVAVDHPLEVLHTQSSPYVLAPIRDVPWRVMAVSPLATSLYCADGASDRLWRGKHERHT